MMSSGGLLAKPSRPRDSWSPLVVAAMIDWRGMGVVGGSVVVRAVNDARWLFATKLAAARRDGAGGRRVGGEKGFSGPSQDPGRQPMEVCGARWACT